jgi:uracil-DNA glycosylase family 4
MEGRTRVLGRANGPLSARILFVAEAPGRLGADVRGVPLSGDRTGHTFDGLLEAAGFDRSAVFITNAVLCNPRDDAGRNDRPARAELANCSGHLARLIAALEPAWVVTLGTVALSALAILERHDLVLRCDVAQPRVWLGRWLVPLYHPGPRALIHRSLADQRDDYRTLATLVASLPTPLTPTLAGSTTPHPGPQPNR